MTDQPQMQCPRCGMWMDDFDGFGVLAHVAPMPQPCGYCVHPTRDRDAATGELVCAICGDRTPDWTRERETGR